MEPIVIIGGGLAGLSAANRLADLGLTPTLIESNSYPSHKVCGEFFSPECLPQLECWDCSPPISIDRVRLSGFEFRLPTPAKSCSRYRFDARLAERAAVKGVQLHTKTKVTNITPGSPHEITLDNGDTIRAKQLIVGTGRVTSQKKPKLPYSGIKAHFKGSLDCLEMHMINGGYYGMSPIEGGKVNVTCLIKGDILPDLETLVPPSFERLFEPLTVRVPTFGLRSTPQWPSSYFIGDAAAVIAPACGDGLAMAITSGVMAADYAVGGHYAAFSRHYLKRYRRRLQWGNLLHWAMLHPYLINLGVRFPSLPTALFKRTREGCLA